MYSVSFSFVRASTTPAFISQATLQFRKSTSSTDAVIEVRVFSTLASCLFFSNYFSISRLSSWSWMRCLTETRWGYRAYTFKLIVCFTDCTSGQRLYMMLWLGFSGRQVVMRHSEYRGNRSSDDVTREVLICNFYYQSEKRQVASPLVSFFSWNFVSESLISL